MPEPPSKRIRLDKAAPTSQQLFAPFRALGVISNDVKFALQSQSAKHLESPAVTITTCLGRSWAMWDVDSLKLLFIGPEASMPISSIVLAGKSIYAAVGSTVIRYLRGKEVGKLSTGDEESTISELTIFGITLCGLSEDGSRMWIWDLETEELYTTIKFESTFTATHIVHPSTYLNKVLVGGQDGSLQLWNVLTNKLIHSFAATGSPVTCLTQSPAVDVLGVGYLDGTVSLQDIKVGEELFKVRMDTEGMGYLAGAVDQSSSAITGIAFRNDNEAQTLATTSAAGHIAVWDLDNQARLLHVLRQAHDGTIADIQFLPGQPVMITASADNSIKEWLFDNPTAAPRLLRSRSGHQAPPHLIRYYGNDGRVLLSAGQDRAFRYNSIVRDSRSHELSQGSIAKKAGQFSVPVSSLKLAPATSMSFSTSRSKDWDDVLTSHSGETAARTWSIENKKFGKYSFGIDTSGRKAGKKGSVGVTKPSDAASVVCVSACGNFGLVAFANQAEIGMWNMQSGIKRKSFEIPSTSSQKVNITGLASDSVNSIVIASTASGQIYFFDFHTSKLLEIVTLPASTSSMVLLRENNLLAVACSDLVVRLLDIETRRIVRELKGSKKRILDLSFSHDGRWLITTSMDSIIRTFDIPTGQLVDAFKVPSIATSLAFSPTGDFLATAHSDNVGVFLWANRAQFAEVSLKAFDETKMLQEATLPTLQGANDEGIETLTELVLPNNWSDDLLGSTEQLSEGLVTMSLMPRSKWQTLLNLETIKQRNKPKEPPKAPEQAPFFIPTLAGTEIRYDLSAKDKVEEEPKSRRLDFGEMQVDSVLVQEMKRDSGSYDKFFEKLLAMSPPALDLEIRSMLSQADLALFLRAISVRLKTHKDFEAVQAILGAFLNVHSDVLSASEDGELAAALKEISGSQEQETSRIRELIRFNLGMVAWVRGLPV